MGGSVEPAVCLAWGGSEELRHKAPSLLGWEKTLAYRTVTDGWDRTMAKTGCRTQKKRGERNSLWGSRAKLPPGGNIGAEC